MSNINFLFIFTVDYPDLAFIDHWIFSPLPIHNTYCLKIKSLIASSQSHFKLKFTGGLYILCVHVGKIGKTHFGGQGWL